MSDMSISDEDRERLVNVKFRELLEKATDDPQTLERIADKILAHARSKAGQPSQQQSTTAANTQPAPAKKRSLFDISISQALGL